jgi:hypothetical protein
MGEEIMHLRTSVSACLLTISVSLFSFFSPVFAQEADSNLRFKNLENLIGNWAADEEIRQSPAEDWEKGSSEWEVRWLPGGYVVQTSGKMRIAEEENTWIQVWGYHPAKDTVVSWYADSSGALGSVTSSGWDGTTFLSNWTDTAPDGIVLIGRCSWKHSSDFKSVTASCEQFTDGKWWTFRKAKGRKLH